MRALFYLGEHEWSSAARVFQTAANGLAARGHQVIVVAPDHGDVAARIATGHQDVDVVTHDASANAAWTAWELRRILQERFVEVAFVHGTRDQLRVSSAMRLAERGAVIRRVPPFASVADGSEAMALRMASGGLLFTTEDDRRAAPDAVRARPIPPGVAPLGIDVATHDTHAPAGRAALGLPDDAVILGCPYEPAGRFQLATVMRSVAFLADRHRNLRVVVFGRGSLDDDLRMHAAALGVASRITFLGNASDPLAIVRACDVTWVTAHGDAGAFGLLDAMALGVPVITERSPLASHYVVDGSTGVLLAPGEPSYVASAVATVLAHDVARQKMGEVGRVRVEREFPERALVDGFEAAGRAAGDRTRWAVR